MNAHAPAPYNPLDTGNLGDSLIRALLKMEPVKLGERQEFAGAGVYAIYYTGDFPTYERIAEANRDGKFRQAIYVGKAIPPGARKGAIATGPITGKHLYRRLEEHASSIRDAENLDINDFYARWLIVDQIWIPLTESLMINKSACVWNQIVEGFGNHNPGKKRSTGRRSKWDTLHPGRGWASGHTDAEKWTPVTLDQEARTWISNHI